MSMPENERDTGPEVEDYYPWDCDNEAAGESDTADLINDSEEDGEDD